MANLLRRPSLLSEMQNLFSTTPWTTEGDLSSAATSTWIPAVDIKEEANQYLILVDVPGVDPKDIEINMENGILTIQGEKKSETKIDENEFSRIERFVGNFYRRFSLPDTADSEGITAQSKHGVLEIKIPKTKHSRSRKIQVKVLD